MEYILYNSGSTCLNWKLTTNINWLSCFPTSGSINPMSTQQVKLNVNAYANNLPSGTYTGSMFFDNLITSSLGPKQLTVIRDVKLIISPISGSNNPILIVNPIASMLITGSVKGPFGFSGLYV